MQDYSQLISIITITFNASQCLRPTMESVASQDFKDFEHIIIDGASTDDTLQIAHSLATPGLRILSEPDKGLYDAMNKGLGMAHGKYLIFLNAGDAFHTPHTLSKYAKAADANCDIIYGDTVIVDKDRHILGPRHLSAPRILTYESFAKGMLVCHQAFMVRHDLAPKYNLEYRFSADYDWTLRCLKKSRPGSCRNLNEVTIDYLCDGLTDKNHRASLLERFDIMRHNFGLMSTLGNHILLLFRALGRKLLN